MSMQALRERLASLKKDARNLLEEKGSATWTNDDKTKFDNMVDEAERVEKQIDAHQRLLNEEAETRFDNVPRNQGGQQRQDPGREGLELYLRKLTNQLSPEEALKIRNTMSTTTGSEGGYTVQSSVASQLIEAIKDFGAMRRVAGRIATASGAPLSYPTTDGTSEVGEWVAQNVQAASADPTFGTVALNVHKVGSKTITIPLELLQDSTVDVIALVQQRIRDRIGRIANQGFTTGDNNGKPNGFVTAASVGKTGATGQTTSIIYDDLVDLIDSLDVAYQNDNCRFMFGQTLRRTIRKIKDTAGRPIWTPSYDAGLTAKHPDLLLGYPVEINNDMAVPAANAKSLGFGDFSKYMIRDAMEVTLFRFEDSAFLTKGQVGFLAWARMGGNLLDTNAIKLYQHSAA